ncbi:MAG: FliA/WhiG family RNA polymerase sigma factor [Anaerotruncus sp.]|nr:FliA/WhiG family RNA polymerase sigma factor [Anaerotruncus sp.]
MTSAALDDWQQQEVENPELLMQMYKETGSQELRNQIVMHYCYIAKSVAMEMSNMFHKYATVEEMVNQGVIALIDSVDRFDPGHGVKFSTYAFTKVRGAIIDYVRKQDWLPRRVRHNAIKINNTYNELTLKLGRNPTREEMAKQLGMSVAEFDKCSYEVSGENVFSYEALLIEGPQSNNLMWSMVAGDSDLEGRIDAEELRRELAAAIDSLNEQERMVLSMYYYENLTMKEIGKVLKVSEQRIGQVNRKLIQKLRERLEKYMKG